MSQRLQSISVKNYRCLADLTMKPGPVNVLFGPNGAGKTTFLDALGFLKDCLKIGVNEAAARRSQGIFLLYDGAYPDGSLELELGSEETSYWIKFSFLTGRIDSRPHERLTNGSSTVFQSAASSVLKRLKESGEDVGHAAAPQKDSLALSISDLPEAVRMRELVESFVSYASRNFTLSKLRISGSVSGHETILHADASNLWSVLRNLHGRRSVDNRYETIMQFMREAHPEFRDLVFDQTGPLSVFGSFVFSDRKLPHVYASEVSDGHLHSLILATALFASENDRPTVVLFDEPETSLHPHAIAVFAEMVKEASATHGKQVFIATHSPVLLSQFAREDLVEMSSIQGRTRVRRVSEIHEADDLLQEYAVGSLYMAEAIGRQSAEPKAES